MNVHNDVVVGAIVNEFYEQFSSFQGYPVSITSSREATDGYRALLTDDAHKVADWFRKMLLAYGDERERRVRDKISGQIEELHQEVQRDLLDIRCIIEQASNNL